MDQRHQGGQGGQDGQDRDSQGRQRITSPPTSGSSGPYLGNQQGQPG